MPPAANRGHRHLLPTLYQRYNKLRHKPYYIIAYSVHPRNRVYFLYPKQERMIKYG